MNTINGNFIEKSIPDTKNATLNVNIGGVDATMTVEKFAAATASPSYTPAYKVYTAQLNMGDGSTTVFENTLGVTLTWSIGLGFAGVYNYGPLIGQNNVYIQVSSRATTSSPKIVSGEFSPSPWAVLIKQTDNAGVADSTQAVFVEIRIYN